MHVFKNEDGELLIRNIDQIPTPMAEVREDLDSSVGVMPM